jgi:D-alanyl-D-alanine dipeptidase
LILSGYRHPILQALIIRQTTKNYSKALADKMFANPDNYAPHTSGAAFDLEIWDEKNNRVLPTKVFGVIDLFTLEEKEDLTLTEREVRDNRRLIYNLLTTDILLNSANAFVAHPFEYWHYGRNERMSAFFAANGHRIYYDVIRQI